MANHINNICNLKDIDGEKVKFITTDNYGVTQTLKDTGDIILLSSSNRHDIYVGGEHIAGGYGFDNDTALETLTKVANSYYSYIEYLGDNYRIIKKIVDNYKDSSDDDPEKGDINPDRNTFGVIDTSYTLALDATGRLCFERDKHIDLNNIGFELTNSSYVINEEPFIVKAGSVLTFNKIYFDIDGTYDVSYLDIYSYTKFDKLRQYRNGSRIWSKNYTYYPLKHSNFKNAYTLTAENYRHTETDGSNVNTLIISHTGSIYDYKDSVLLALKDETMSNPGYPFEFCSPQITWQLPYFYGLDAISDDKMEDINTSSSVIKMEYRTDQIVDSMVETEITINFGLTLEERSFAYFACPTQWGEPKFIHKASGLSHVWDRVNTNPVQIFINGIRTNYNIYKSRIEYYGGPIKWIISNKED